MVFRLTKKVTKNIHDFNFLKNQTIIANDTFKMLSLVITERNTKQVKDYIKVILVIEITANNLC